MKHKIYLNTSDLKTAICIRSCDIFEPVPQYDVLDRHKAHQYEFGKLKTKEIDFHIIIGNPPKKNCPWCGSEPVLTRLPHKSLLGFDRFCLECRNCGSQGPIMNIAEADLIGKKQWMNTKTL